MILASLNETLENIADIVNKCLGPLGSDGFSFNTIRDFFNSNLCYYYLICCC
ncbi:MAG: hypothetical protein L6U99_09930 [Clostridium sp.]|nr:MAG: hypothetical protein L6U99_09930 [Clostridium sp.]